jgi:hypothetical protein
MEEKINQLRTKLEIYKISFTQGANVLAVDREDVFSDSLNQYATMDHQKVKKTKDYFYRNSKLCSKERCPRMGRTLEVWRKSGSTL